MEIFHLLEQSPIVSNFEILEFRTWDDGFYFKIKIQIRDGSLLFAREFYNQDDRHYSFHSQDAKGGLLVRWDDAPHHRHHRQLMTFPYHKHIKDQVVESLPVGLTQVLAEITTLQQ